MKLAIFDFDGTLLSRDTLPCLGREWLRQKRSKLCYILVYLSIVPDLLWYRMGLISREGMKAGAFRKFNYLFSGMNAEEIKIFFHQAYPGLRKHFNSRIIKEIDLARSQGYHCVLLSGSYSELMKMVAADLGLDTVIAARLAFKDGIFDPEGDTPFIDGESKCSLLKETFAGQEVHWKASRCFADSVADVKVMGMVGEPVAVNPDPGLLSHAMQEDWRVLSG
ncbi:MAG: HAD family hydrolase [Syntrophomonas sp.]|uniref:HAD family hydrolase n=1 Tax=Syntrophomonas sp. TaxID=2053627 RepID=UPI0026099D94|nr:HAD family hydrolase [Syntrophomonas sp.]MDD2510342.1 HAD family hydrolase [Syntrophomonas sp.]MDD3878613.1 HAD family hydrolase [Syntrophomonas sp.]MDD4627495.1 HAD family hydrolase [Syntrophomonas sp.]